MGKELKSVFLFVILFFVEGCVVVPKKSVDSLYQKTLVGPSCVATPVKLSFYEEFTQGFTTKQYVQPREKRPSDVDWSSDFINAEINRAAFFTPESTSPKYIIEFQTYYAAQANIAEQAWFWSTIATLGIFPSWGHGSIQLKAIVKDSFGKVLAEFKSSEAEFHTINWLILAPFNIGDRNTNKELVSKVAPKLTDEILNQMLAAHLICGDLIKKN